MQELTGTLDRCSNLLPTHELEVPPGPHRSDRRSISYVTMGRTSRLYRTSLNTSTDQICCEAFPFGPPPPQHKNKQSVEASGEWLCKSIISNLQILYNAKHIFSCTPVSIYLVPTSPTHHLSKSKSTSRNRICAFDFASNQRSYCCWFSCNCNSSCHDDYPFLFVCFFFKKKIKKKIKTPSLFPPSFDFCKKKNQNPEKSMITMKTIN